MTFVMLPVDSVITQPFGENPTRNLPANHPTILAYGNYQPWGHDGIDFGCWTGTPVRVPGRGRVVFSGFGEDMPYDVCIRFGFSTDPSAKWASGIIVLLDHGNGVGSYYAHLSRSDFDHMVGQWIEAGTVMGLSGNTGRSGGDHLHWSAVNLPVNYSDGLYSRRNPLDFVTTVNVIPIAPGNTGSPSIAEEIDVSAEQNILARLEQIVAWQDRRINDLAEFTRAVVNGRGNLSDAEVAKKLDALKSVRPSGVQLFKSADDGAPDVFVYDEGKGFRHIGKPEYDALVSAGATVVKLPKGLIERAAA